MLVLKKNFGIFFILLLSAGLFHPVGSFGFLNWDDHLYITSNPLVNGSTTLKAVFTQTFEGHYHPVLLLSLRIDYFLGEGHPAIFHWHNLLLHLLNILLLYALLRSLCPGGKLAFWLALLFAIHPLQIEAVAWATARKDLLYAFWALLTLHAWVRVPEQKPLPLLLLSLLFFLMACLSKAQAVMVAPVLLLLDYHRGGMHLLKKQWMRYIPFFLLALVFGAVAIWAQEDSGYTSAESYSTSFFWLLRYAGLALMMYVFRLFMPLQLSAYYPYPVPGEDIPFWLFNAALPISILLAVLSAFLLWRKKAAGIAFAVFLLLLLPMLRLIPVSNFITADRYTYLALPAFFLGVVFFLPEKLRPYLLGLFAGLMFLVSWQRLPVWKDSESLLNNVLRHHPSVLPALNARGDLYMESGRFAEAEADFSRAIQMRPQEARAWRNRALLRAMQQDWKPALSDFDTALALMPLHSGTLVNRARVKEMLGDSAGALADISRALEINPSYHTALGNRANLFIAMGNLSGAEKDLARALDLAPSEPAYLASLAHCRLLQGKAVEALQMLDQLWLNEYRHPLILLLRAKSLAQTGQQAAARNVLEEMLSRWPAYSEAWRLLSVLAYDLEDYPRSENAAARALALGWNRGEALWLRGRARMMLERTEEACRDLNAASMLGWEKAGREWQEQCLNP